MKDQDFLQTMGHTALGSRLKRAGVLMQTISQTWLKRQGCDVPSAQMPVIAMLFRQGPAPAGEMASRLGVAQPGMSRMIDQMEKSGLVRTAVVSRDRRVREVALTGDGERLARTASLSYWPVIEAVASAMTDGLSGSFADQLSALEDRLGSGAMEAEFDRLERRP